MSVLDLWLPILVAGVVTHVLSTLAWTLLPHHVPEWQRLPDEDEFQDWLAARDVKDGQYVFPMTRDQEEMQSDAFKEKQGKCTGMLVMWSSPVNMGAAIGKTLAFFLVIAFCIGYVASMAFDGRTPTGFDVFRFTATVALLTHCAGLFPGVFWFKRKIALDLLDKAVYGLATGLVFMLLWPSA